MRRVVVIGRGVFGRAVADQLFADGITPLTAARRGNADLRLDVEDRESLAAVLNTGDVVVDTAGPYNRRTTTLVEYAVANGVDVVDINETMNYALAVRALASAAASSGIRVLSSCSSVSVLSHALVVASGVEPQSVSVLLMPASAEAASAATTAAALESLRHRPRVRRNGSLARIATGQRRHFAMFAPFADVSAAALESADALLLADAWPEIRNIDFWLDPGVPGGAAGVALAIRLGLGGVLRRVPSRALVGAVRWVGRHRGAFAVETRDRNGTAVTAALWAPQTAHRMAAIPAAIAAAALARNAAIPAGVVPPHLQVRRDVLVERLGSAGVGYADSRGGTAWSSL